MNRIKTGLMATVLSFSFAAPAVQPVNAASFYVPQSPIVSSDIVAVAGRGDGRYIYRKRHHHRRSQVRRHRNGHHYWRGHRGYRHYRPGYRRHGDFWFPFAAFAAGAIIGGAMSNDRPAFRSDNAHVRWCYDHYRSYRASDDTYQPYNGPRRRCRSPY